VDRLVEDLDRQTFQDFELLLSIGVHPNGRARNVGARETRGDYLVFIDDDVRLGHEHLLDNLLKALREHPDIGLVGASQQLPPWSTALQRRMADQLPRSRFPVVDRFTETDMVTHMCLALRRAVWDEVGGESDTLVRGTDPDLRYRVRAAGYRVGVVPDTWAYHPMPAGMRKLLRAWYSAGQGAASVFLESPEMVIDAPDSFQERGTYRRTFSRRVLDAAARTARAVLDGQEIRLICQAAYGAGYVAEVLNRAVRLRLPA
jgi:cellulose synthase/poly-beta-1,6-N-acetylglucosamine synthase-like glycosyltransferase